MTSTLTAVRAFHDSMTELMMRRAGPPRIPRTLTIWSVISTPSTTEDYTINPANAAQVRAIAGNISPDNIVVLSFIQSFTSPGT